ncbi:hypothetical protein FRC12_009579 [Ceratobasidium sp. 428]|nr:hypothetical protein FRC12_009579 [Ceratobasidium sp. 428]
MTSRLDSKDMGNIRPKNMDTRVSTAVFACFAVSIPTLVLLQLRARKSKFVKNPAPRLVSGCTLKTSPLGAGAYVGPFIYETGIFLLTVYKTWKISPTPLMQRLMRDGSKYYLMVIVTLLLIGASSFSPNMRRAMTGSGVLTAIVSTMCSRLILSGLAFYDENQSQVTYSEINSGRREVMDSRIPGSEWL